MTVWWETPLIGVGLLLAFLFLTPSGWLAMWWTAESYRIRLYTSAAMRRYSMSRAEARKYACWLEGYGRLNASQIRALEQHLDEAAA